LNNIYKEEIEAKNSKSKRDKNSNIPENAPKSWRFFRDFSDKIVELFSFK